MFQGDRKANALRCYCMRPLLTLCEPQIDPKLLFHTISSRLASLSNLNCMVNSLWYWKNGCWLAEIGLSGGYIELLWLFVLVSSLNHQPIQYICSLNSLISNIPSHMYTEFHDITSTFSISTIQLFSLFDG